MKSFGVEVYGYEKNGRGKATKTLFESDMDGRVTLQELLQFTKQALLTIAVDALNEEQRKGFDKEPRVLVDGSGNKRLKDVNPLGKIQFVTRQNFSQIILDTYIAIQSRSPSVTGEFFRGNVVTYNGREIARTMPQLEAWMKEIEKDGFSFRPSDRIRFINVVPYARKLENLGVTKGRTKPRVDQKQRKRSSPGYVAVPNGVYSLAVRAIKRKYKGNSNIKFTFLPGESLGITGSDRDEKTGKPRRRTFKKDGRPYLYPTITITALEDGSEDVRSVQ